MEINLGTRLLPEETIRQFDEEGYLIIREALDEGLAMADLVEGAIGEEGD